MRVAAKIDDPAPAILIPQWNDELEMSQAEIKQCQGHKLTNPDASAQQEQEDGAVAWSINDAEKALVLVLAHGPWQRATPGLVSRDTPSLRRCLFSARQ